jgi:hypothetical protein
MIQNIVEAIKEQAEHIQGVKFFRYEGQDLINAQNNNSTIQIWVEDDIYCEYLVTRDMLKVQINIDILDKYNQGDDKLLIHSNTNKIGIVLMKLMEENYNISIYDYSLLNLSGYSDDDLYGTRLSLYLLISSPINACNIDEYIDTLNKFDEYIDDDIEIKLPEIDINNIDINPIKLKRNE